MDSLGASEGISPADTRRCDNFIVLQPDDAISAFTIIIIESAKGLACALGSERIAPSCLLVLVGELRHFALHDLGLQYQITCQGTKSFKGLANNINLRSQGKEYLLIYHTDQTYNIASLNLIKHLRRPQVNILLDHLGNDGYSYASHLSIQGIYRYWTLILANPFSIRLIRFHNGSIGYSAIVNYNLTMASSLDVRPLIRLSGNIAIIILVPLSSAEYFHKCLALIHRIVLSLAADEPMVIFLKPHPRETTPEAIRDFLVNACINTRSAIRMLPPHIPIELFESEKLIYINFDSSYLSSAVSKGRLYVGTLLGLRKPKESEEINCVTLDDIVLNVRRFAGNCI